MASIEEVVKQIERRDDDKPVKWIVIGIIFIIILNRTTKEIPPQVNVIFEDKKTICFQKEDIGTWCVDKTIKDIWVWDKK